MCLCSAVCLVVRVSACARVLNVISCYKAKQLIVGVAVRIMLRTSSLNKSSNAF